MQDLSEHFKHFFSRFSLPALNVVFMLAYFGQLKLKLNCDGVLSYDKIKQYVSSYLVDSLFDFECSEFFFYHLKRCNYSV